MRFAVAAVALVATLQCCSTGVSAASAPSPTPLRDAAAKKAVEELVAVPIDLMWKDVYEALVHKKGSRALRRLRFLTAGLFGKDDVLELTYFLMDRLKKEVFNDRVNKAIWETLTMELYYALKDWWSSTPENPKDAADLGVWHALVNLYKDVLAPSLRGSHRVGTMNDLLLDPDLRNIKKWVSEWRGVPPPQYTLPPLPVKESGKQKSAKEEPDASGSD